MPLIAEDYYLERNPRKCMLLVMITQKLTGNQTCFGKIYIEGFRWPQYNIFLSFSNPNDFDSVHVDDIVFVLPLENWYHNICTTIFAWHFGIFYKLASREGNSRVQRKIRDRDNLAPIENFANEINE